jgi:hypothetical protein
LPRDGQTAQGNYVSVMQEVPLNHKASDCIRRKGGTHAPVLERFRESRPLHFFRTGYCSPLAAQFRRSYRPRKKLGFRLCFEGARLQPSRSGPIEMRASAPEGRTASAGDQFPPLNSGGLEVSWPAQRFTAAIQNSSRKSPWEGHGFTACGKARASYQGMPSGIPQSAHYASGFSRCWRHRESGSPTDV